jgi:hypothetical protein
MQFEQAYHVPSMDLEVRVYSTKRAGVYGWQFAAIVWYKGDGYASERTSGCGYDKVSTCVAEALYRACTKTERGFSDERKKRILAFAGTGACDKAIAEFLGVDYSDWRKFSAWKEENLIHSHG